MASCKDISQSILFGHPEPLAQPHQFHRIFEISLRSEDAPFFGLHFEERFIPYCEVNRRANIAARALSNYILTTTDWSKRNKRLVIAVDIQPCENLIIALLAILKIGAAYVPVDSNTAINRVRYVLNQAEPACVVVDNLSAFKLDPDTVWSRFHVVDINDLLSQQSKEISTERNLADEEMLTTPKLLSVIYTSGSTGRPKGVCLSHQTALNRIYWQWETFPFRTKERGCFKTSLLFVDSIVEIFSCVLKLVSLVICPRDIVCNPEEFVKLMEQQNVSRLTMVPSMLRNILFFISIGGSGQRLPCLKLWICNSETLPPNLLHKFFEIYPNDRVFCNFYGSTETMADVTYEVFRTRTEVDMKSFDNSLSIGRPMFNNNIYIVDDAMELVALGDVGEVCVSGFNVADGYMDDERTTNCFIKNTFLDHKDHYRVYRTGDFARLYNGMLIFEGRRDSQIKIRGQRVNIAEIEKVIQDCPCVDKTAVLCHKLSEISSVIVAYYTTSTKQKPGHLETAIMESCRRSLPSYMCPKLVFLDEIPLQAHTGKVDRVALRSLYEKAFNRQSSMELQKLDEKGRKALNIIALNLNIPANAVPRDSTFFEAGGNSVSMISTLVQLKQYGLFIPLETFIRASSIQDIVDKVETMVSPVKQEYVPYQVDNRILHSDEYDVCMLHEVPYSEQIIDVLTDSFIEKEPLDVLLGVTRCEFLPFARSLYRQALKYRHSIIVLERQSRQVVGGDFLFDYFQGVQVEHHPSMAPVLKLLQDFEGPVKEELRQSNPGRLLFNFCLCVHKDLPHAHQVKICHLIEGNVLRVAKENGFIGVVTNNTNPVTQDICEHFFDYQLLDVLHVRDYVFNGRKVFGHAPEDYYIKMMIRYV